MTTKSSARETLKKACRESEEIVTINRRTGSDDIDVLGDIETVLAELEQAERDRDDALLGRMLMERERDELGRKLERVEGTLATEQSERIRCRDGWSKAEREAEKWEHLHDEDTAHLSYEQARDSMGPTETLNETAVRLVRERDEARRSVTHLRTALDEESHSNDSLMATGQRQRERVDALTQMMQRIGEDVLADPISYDSMTPESVRDAFIQGWNQRGERIAALTKERDEARAGELRQLELLAEMQRVRSKQDVRIAALIEAGDKLLWYTEQLENLAYDISEQIEKHEIVQGWERAKGGAK